MALALYVAASYRLDTIITTHLTLRPAGEVKLLISYISTAKKVRSLPRVCSYTSATRQVV
jgi:hypothetical protein